MSRILNGLEGVVCLDDIFVVGQDQKQHHTRLLKVLQRIEQAGVTLNSDKCLFSRSKVKFLGHIVDKEGVKADPCKTAAIVDMSPPTNITELRRFLGMVNQLAKFTPNLAELSQNGIVVGSKPRRIICSNQTGISKTYDINHVPSYIKDKHFC